MGMLRCKCNLNEDEWLPQHTTSALVTNNDESNLLTTTSYSIGPRSMLCNSITNSITIDVVKSVYWMQPHLQASLYK